MAEQIGDVSELHKQTKVVHVVQPIVGADTPFHFRLVDTPAIASYLNSYALVKINGPLQFELSAPITSTVAATASIAVIPDKYEDWPETREQVAELEGSITVKDAILVPTSLVVEGEVAQVSIFLSHKTLTDYQPAIVGHLNVAGGSATSRSLLKVKVPLLLTGVAHRKTW